MSSRLWRKCFCSENTGRGSGIKVSSVSFHMPRGKQFWFLSSLLPENVFVQRSPLSSPTHFPSEVCPFHTFQNYSDGFFSSAPFSPSSQSWVSVSSGLEVAHLWRVTVVFCRVTRTSPSSISVTTNISRVGPETKMECFLKTTSPGLLKINFLWRDVMIRLCMLARMESFSLWHLTSPIQLFSNYFSNSKGFPAYFPNSEARSFRFFSSLVILEIRWSEVPIL